MRLGETYNSFMYSAPFQVHVCTISVFIQLFDAFFKLPDSLAMDSPMCEAALDTEANALFNTADDSSSPKASLSNSWTRNPEVIRQLLYQPSVLYAM